MTEAEVVKLVKEWKDEIKGVVTDYNVMLHKLDAAVTHVKATEKKPWVVYRVAITIGLTVAGLLLAIFLTGVIMSHTNLCVVNVNADGKSIVITSCNNVKVDDNGQKTIQTTN